MFGSVVTSTANAGGFRAITNSSTAISARVFPRLSQIAICFQYYAFRRLRLYYIPACNTGVSGSLCYGLDKQVNNRYDTDFLSSGISDAVILNMNPSIETPVWTPSVIEAKFDGDRVWANQRQTEDSKDYVVQTDYDEFQFALFGLIFNGVDNGTYGRFVVEYEVDFYEPVYPSGNFSGPVIPTSSATTTSSASSTISAKSETVSTFVDSEEKEMSVNDDKTMRELKPIPLTRQNGFNSKLTDISEQKEYYFVKSSNSSPSLSSSSSKGVK